MRCRAEKGSSRAIPANVWFMRIGALVGPGAAPGAPLDDAVRRLGKQLDRRRWAMV
ncbi:MAG: hypothetical protein LC721_01350 [Actinobacteria bacterium]|nr:hypothetical protein [Actinomycetota bacterium]